MWYGSVIYTVWYQYQYPREVIAGDRPPVFVGWKIIVITMDFSFADLATGLKDLVKIGQPEAAWTMSGWESATSYEGIIGVDSPEVSDPDFEMKAENIIVKKGSSNAGGKLLVGGIKVNGNPYGFAKGSAIPEVGKHYVLSTKVEEWKSKSGKTGTSMSAFLVAKV